jgi:tetratricopeptide (TPR) repeat protein
MVVHSSIPENALKTFETAHKAFWKGDYAKALSGFEKLVDQDGLDNTFTDRLLSYIDVCKKRLGVEDQDPKSAEELYLAGVFELNRGEVKNAIDYLKQSIGKDKKNDAYRYTLACAYAVNGEADETTKSLKAAIEMNPDNRIFARNCAEIAALAKNDKNISAIIRDE